MQIGVIIYISLFSSDFLVILLISQFLHSTDIAVVSGDIC